MILILKIAFRNLFRHKGRSIAIGGVIMIGVFFMILGMATIKGMERGIRKNVVKGFVGDVTIYPADRKDDNLGSSFEPLEVIKNYQKVQETLSSLDYVDSFLFEIYGAAAMLDLSLGSADYDQPDMIFLWGVSMEKYYQMCGDNIVVLEGKTLEPGEPGILINTKQREWIFNQFDVWIVPENTPLAKENLTKEALASGDRLITRSDLVLMGMSGGMTATDVRAPVKGIFKYRHLNDVVWANMIDIGTSRETMGYIGADDIKTDLSAAQKELLKSVDENPEELFSQDTLFEMPAADISTDLSQLKRVKETNIKTNRKDSGVYNIAQVNLKPGIPLNEGVRRLNQSFKEANIDDVVRAVSWEISRPGVRNLIATFRVALMLLVGVIYFAAILMITNSLSMAAMERKAEIGTMRMVGAQKKLIANMFIAETSLLSFLFGGFGILAGIVAIKLLAAAQLTSSINLILILFGGDTYHPILDTGGIISGIIQLAIITMLAMIYPVIVARRIQPMDAVQ